MDLHPAGGAPLWLSQRFALNRGPATVFIKDERYGPTLSFKDRQAAGAVAATISIRKTRSLLRLVREGGFTPFALEALADLASLQVKRGELEHALELLLVILNHPASFPETKNRASNLWTDLQAQFTPVQIESIQAHTAEKTFEVVVEEILR